MFLLHFTVILLFILILNILLLIFSIFSTDLMIVIIALVFYLMNMIPFYYIYTEINLFISILYGSNSNISYPIVDYLVALNNIIGFIFLVQLIWLLFNS